MSKNTETSSSDFPSGEATFGWRKTETKKQASSVDIATFLPPSAFKVYDKVSEKNRYVPRKWTQEEFEAALPQRFEETGNNKNQCPSTDFLEDVHSEDDWDQLSDTNNELKSCNESEAEDKLSNDEGTEDEMTDGEVGGKNESAGNRRNSFTSFMDSCLQCLLNFEPIAKSLNSSTGKTSSIDNDKTSPEKLQQLCLQDVFPKLYKKVQEQSRSCDEALECLLKTLIEQDGLRSVFQGKFCHATVCERCETVVKEYQPFTFLNPTSPPTQSHALQVNLLSCKDGVWQISSKETLISPDMTVAHLKEQLINYPEFLSEVSDIEIGQVKESCLEKVFDDSEDLWELRVEPSSSIVAFHIVNCDSELGSEQDVNCPKVVKSGGSRRFADMSYHLYFNCGLCLNDGKELDLLMHQSCGGMVCRECLDEILHTNRGWQQLCPCPICERPIDLDKEFRTTKLDLDTKTEQTLPDVISTLVLRTAGYCHGGSNIELFGCPLLVSLPRESSAIELYRFIGDLLPKTLPIKAKTSFTLHKVDKSGLCCAGCSFVNCTGCLIHINDNLTIQPGTCLAVHFDDMEESSKKDFGIKIHPRAQISKTQALFDGILQSCVEASSSKETLCPKCFNMSETTSSISEFPQLLVINLNKQYAVEGLPADTIVADVAKFFILERGNEVKEDSKRGSTYQLKAAVLQDNSSTQAPTYKTFSLGASNKWLLYDGIQVDEMHPTQLYLTNDSVLFYEPVADPGPQLDVCQKLESMSDDFINQAYDIHYRKLPNVNRLDPITEARATYSTANKFHYNRHFMLKSSNNQLEPGECFPSNDLRLHTGSELNGSRLSLGEVQRGTHVSLKRPTTLENLDTISPIYTTDVWKSEARVIKETTKLVKAVKREDAYNIVCSLNRGADPRLLINDASALHLAAGIKSDQRHSIITYLLRYCGDVNVPTSDGTTPMHVAAAWGHLDALELLLSHGGDAFEVTDLEGHSAFDLAAKDCSTYLQSVYHRHHSTHFLELSGSYASLANHKTPKSEDVHDTRLEDIVRSNVDLPSFVDDKACVRRRWLRRLRNFRERSSGILRSFRKISNFGRRSRIGVMVIETEKSKEDDLCLKFSNLKVQA